VETLDLKDPNEPDSADSSGGGDGQAASGGGDIDSLIGALAAELRNGNVEKDDVKLLRKAFDVVDEGSGGSVDARIQHLQTEVSDLLAYTDALEEFLDENGTAEQTIEEFRTELEGLQSDLGEVGDLARSHEEVISDVRSTVDSVESSMESLESDMDEVLEDVETVQNDVDDVEGAVENVEESVDDVEQTVDDVEGTVETVETSVEEVEGELENLESQIGDIDVEDVRDDIDDINEEIEELKEWREQLSSVIGGS